MSESFAYFLFFVLWLLSGLAGALALMPLAGVAILLIPSWRSRAPLRRFAYVALAGTVLCVAAFPELVNAAGGWIFLVRRAVATRPIPLIAVLIAVLAMIAFFAWRSVRAQGRGRFVWGGLAAVGYIAISGAVLLLPWVNSERVETRNVAAAAHGVLDPDFHFLLSLPDYKPARLVYDNDIFSSWGELTLARTSGRQTTRALIREEMLKAAKNTGWTSVHADDTNVEPPDDLDRFGITHTKEDLALSKRVPRNEPGRLGCLIWISDDGANVLAMWRIDGH